MVRFPGTVVVGVDGSPESVWASRVGERAADRAGTACHLVYALSPSWDFMPEPDTARARVAATLRGAVRADTIERMAIRRGRPDAVLRQVAGEVGAGLIVLGGKRRSTFQRLLADSTTTHVIRTTKVPVLVAVDGVEPRGRVLAAVDVAVAAAAPTIATAQDTAEFFGGELRVLNVMEPLPVVSDVVSYDLAGYYSMLEEHVKEDIWPLIRDLSATKVTRRGFAVGEILHEAEEWGARLVVVGSHGKGWVDRLLIGSVTEQLLNTLSTPLLIVPVREALAAADQQALAVAHAEG